MNEGVKSKGGVKNVRDGNLVFSLGRRSLDWLPDKIVAKERPDRKQSRLINSPFVLF